jgi:hypothetical protein
MLVLPSQQPYNGGKRNRGQDLAKLPNAEKALIQSEKIEGYILSSAHPVGRFKAAFFRKFGYSAENSDEFEQSLRQMVMSQDVSGVEETSYGRKYVVEGLMRSPSGEDLQIVTVGLY